MKLMDIMGTNGVTSIAVCKVRSVDLRDSTLILAFDGGLILAFSFATQSSAKDVQVAVLTAMEAAT